MATPITEVRLLSGIKLDKDLRHSRDWANTSAQSTFFSGKTITGGSFTNLTHRREEVGLRLPINVETARTVNYMMYKNGNKSTKWYYAFIDSIKYINDIVSLIEYTIDPIQSYFFEMKDGLKDSFIERKHSKYDALIDELVPEGIEIGDLINNAQFSLPQLDDLCIVVGATYDPYTQSRVLGDMYRGTYSGLQYRWFRSNGAGVDVLTLYLELMETQGKTDSIVTMYMFPTEFIDVGSSTAGVIDPDDNVSISIQVGRIGINDDIDGYIPYNNKLFSYPYNYLEVINHQGGSLILKYERFNTTGAIAFTVQCDQGPSPTLLLRPANYSNTSVNNQETLTLGDYPLCAWINDYYGNWFAQNKGKLTTGLGGGIVAVGIGAAMGNPVAVVGGVGAVIGSLGQLRDQSIRPDQMRGTPSGSTQANVNILNFGFYQKTITSEYAIKIDMFFQAYGYKSNIVETPVFNHRFKWDYVKTRDCNLFMNAPNEITERIKKAFNDGVTFWHDDDIGNYSRSNATVL